ncbi:MAG TPA: bifunctional hydroxymethylpyrimidine kinase/phosphomethylpyrimidine kinase [Pyrinomonadaceae bacterium]|jgi:hydroxymethylpyrimidine kinase/phosphomethylpyrimidine kinase|nr:bifunctional hydroxymethylpyrimidine kinase/phosphomethylpyrimidine kinase [Pyrinomonadaceae bacterium]
MNRPVVLTIAGLDPSGGAGIVADIKTISALGCFPAAALTSITYQNTTGVFGAEHQSAETLRGQVEPVIRDLNVVAAKTGMLPTAEIVAEVARLFSEEKLQPPVVDPVMVSTSGHDLIGEEAFQILKSRLLPLARIVTPNIPEAERLAGLSIETESDMRRAAEAIRALGVRAVLVKGGHRAIQQQAIDLLLDDDGNFVEFREEYIDLGEIHGSGCTLSAAIAAGLGKGMTLEGAVRSAKTYITQQIRLLRLAPRIGHGARPL